MPPLVEMIAAHKIPFVGALSKVSHDGKTVPTTTFKQLLNSAFHPDVQQKDWDDLSYIADPYRCVSQMLRHPASFGCSISLI